MTKATSQTSEAAARYADAFFDVANDAGALDAVDRDLATLRGFVSEADDLRILLESPAFDAETKARGLAAVAKGVGFHPLTANLLGVAAANRRARDLPAIAAAFRERMDAHRGLTPAQVITATALTDSERDAVRAALGKALGRDVAIRETVSPQILGGLIVKIGSRMFDDSIKTKLDGLSQAMKGA